MKKEGCICPVEHAQTAKRAQENMLLGEEVERVCNLFRVLSEPSRLKIVMALLQGEMCVLHIAESVNGAQSAVSHQLRVLKDNGVVKSRREGQNICYSLADAHIIQIIQIAAEHSACL